MSNELIDSQDTCPKCQSHRWMRGLPMRHGTHHVTTNADENFWVGQVAVSRFQASICGDCGYSELYAVNYDELWEEWRKKNT